MSLEFPVKASPLLGLKHEVEVPMPLRERFDRVLLGAAILQTVAGLALLASASWLIATERYGLPGSYFVSWQAATALIGLGVLVICMHLKSSLLSDTRLLWIAVGGVWLLLAAAFLGPKIANTHRWVSFGGLSLQPSVLARLVLVIFTAVQLERAQREDFSWKRLLVIYAVATVTAGLIVAEPDLGSSALLIIILAAMLFVAGIRLQFLMVPALLSIVALVIAVCSAPYRLKRVLGFFDGSAGAASCWQTYQSLVALGSGGMFGKGYGRGVQKLFFLPEPHTDFIFAIAGEELGFIGSMLMLILVATITWRGFVIATRLRRPELSLIAFGLAFSFAAQSLIHMAVCLDMLPPKGIPLPLVSYGKTDLVVSMASIGLLLNLSREVTS